MPGPDLWFWILYAWHASCLLDGTRVAVLGEQLAGDRMHLSLPCNDQGLLRQVGNHPHPQGTLYLEGPGSAYPLISSG